MRAEHASHRQGDGKTTEGDSAEVQGGPRGPHVSAGKLKEPRWEHVVGRKWDSRLGGSAEGTPAHQQSWNGSGTRLWVPVKTPSRRELNETKRH